MTGPASVRMPRPHPVPDGAFRSDDDVLFWSALGIHLLPRVDLVERD